MIKKDKVLFVDIIGIHSGMKYYDDSFVNELNKIGIEVEVISNFSNLVSTSPFFLNFFEGCLFTKMFKLIFSYIKYIIYILFAKYKCIIYLSYGYKLDILFMIPTFFSKRYILDIHEYLYIGTNKHKSTIKKIFDFFYSRFVYCCISHSSRTDKFLENIKYNKKILKVPHFKYIFNKGYNVGKIDSEILDVFKHEKINILFFGHIRETKGVDIFIEAIELLNAQMMNKCHFVVAGNDTEGRYQNIFLKIRKTISCTCVFRYVTDEELNYLFDNTDYVILPYKEISQSGILETAVYFRKPVIVSKLDYFETFLREYPSFGISFFPITASEILKTLEKVINTPLLYSEEDINEFYYRDKVELFLVEFREYYDGLCLKNI